MNEKQQLKELADQLSHPKGNMGVEIGNQMNESNISMTLHSMECLNLHTNEKVMELGHGNCAHLPFLMEKGVIYYGLEVSELMYAEATKMHPDAIAQQRAFFELYDGINISFETDFFDKIFTVNTIYFWVAPEKLLSELCRVLKTKGILNITFAQKAFMEQLPFAQFGFELYDNEKVLKLTEFLPLEVLQTDSHIESVKSKAGTMVNREFTTISFRKI